MKLIDGKGNIMKKFDTVIFDLDGTILDTLDDLADSANASMRRYGYPEHSREAVRCFVGNGIQKLIERCLPEGTDEETVLKVLADFREYYGAHCRDKTRPYDGIMELLKDLRAAGYKTAVVSNKADFAVQELCTYYFPGLFDFVVGERTGVRKKPAPDSVFEVLQQLKVEKGNAVYVGDSDVDIATAQNAQMDSMIVTWGFRDREFLVEKGAEKIAATPEELKEML